MRYYAANKKKTTRKYHARGETAVKQYTAISGVIIFMQFCKGVVKLLLHLKIGALVDLSKGKRGYYARNNICSLPNFNQYNSLLNFQN